MTQLGSAIHLSGLGGEPVTVDRSDVEALGAALQGPMLWPGEPLYERAISIWNGMIDRRPGLVIRPAGSRDVQEVIRFAALHRILLSVKGGGHHVAGLSLAEGGLMLDMSGLRTVDVDPLKRRVRVGAGCLLGEVDRATQRYGLATVLGSDALTGVAGFTLGGGFGYLTRRFGWAVDNLVEVELVTAGGELVRAAEDENSDLFWALRGGGGNFGVVTSFTFNVHDIGTEVTGGLVVWPADRAGEVLALYRHLAEAGPRELTLAVSLRPAPAASFIPVSLQGKPIIAVLACHTGSAAEADADLKQLRSFGRPVADLIRRKPYVEQQVNLGSPQPDGLHRYWKSEFLAALPDPLLGVLAEKGAAATAPEAQLILFQLGGAGSAIAPDATAFANRDAKHIVFVAGCWQGGDPGRDDHIAWVRGASAAVAPYSTGTYVNAQAGDEGRSGTRAAYHANLERLAAIKAAHDPDRLFRMTRNVEARQPAQP